MKSRLKKNISDLKKEFFRTNSYIANIRKTVKNMNFLIEFIKHPRKIGAVAPSGKALAEKMMQPIDFDSAEVIVEYGSGTGAFTAELIKRRRKDTALILVEQNEIFCRELLRKFAGEPNFHIVHGKAERVEKYLKKYGFSEADYIVSGLPFTSLPTEISDRILKAAGAAIGESGSFITFQYSLVKKKFFEKYFDISNCLREIKNLPPAYVFVMKNRSENGIK